MLTMMKSGVPTGRIERLFTKKMGPWFFGIRRICSELRTSGSMRRYICPNCKAYIHEPFLGYCPECLQVLNLSRQELLEQQVSLLHSSARKEMLEEKWRQAINDLIMLLTLDPHHCDAKKLLEEARYHHKLARLYERADNYRSDRKWEKAVSALEKIIAIDPEYKDAHALISVIEREKKEEKHRRSKRRTGLEKLLAALVTFLVVVFVLLFIIGMLYICFTSGGLLTQ